MTNFSVFAEVRRQFHSDLMNTVLIKDKSGVPSNADKDNRTSVDIANKIFSLLEEQTKTINNSVKRRVGQTSGNKFESICADFLQETFYRLKHIRPGDWKIRRISGRNRLEIAKYEQYSHLAILEELAGKNPALAAALGNDYTITPDVVIERYPVPDKLINQSEFLIDESVSRLTSLRKRDIHSKPLLHASISCKWTIRSDRAQNARSEALNLIRNRKGRLPHIVVVTAEPLPTRLASLALGTGDIDCVYHFALFELKSAVDLSGFEEQGRLLGIMIDGNRLKDISDLPLDLVI